MQATNILQNEHRVIEQVLSCLEKIANQALNTGVLDQESAEQALDFFKQFADQCHHGKEETCLFPMMEARGFPRVGGPTGVMLSEHDEGRFHIRAMTDAAAAADPLAAKRFAQHARAYVDLLRNHILQEDHRLFPMADQVLTPQDQQKLLAQFAAVEHEDMGEGTHEKYLEIANALADRYEVPRALPMALACGCGHGSSL